MKDPKVDEFPISSSIQYAPLHTMNVNDTWSFLIEEKDIVTYKQSYVCVVGKRLGRKFKTRVHDGRLYVQRVA